jgi:hypothetical protein
MSNFDNSIRLLGAMASLESLFLEIVAQIRGVPGEDPALRTVLDFGILRAEIRAFYFPSNNWKHEGTKLNGTDSVRRPTHLARHGEELL